MFGLGPLQLGLLVLLLALVEVALFWAAASLADAPPLGWGKTFTIALGVAAIWAAINAAIGWATGVAGQPLTPETRSTAFALGALALGVSWAVPAILYSPLLPVSLGRGMKISIFQALLRAFFYVFFAAVVMVVLAVVQIASAPSGG